MLEFYYDFLDYYLLHEDFEIIEIDTDSNYIRITAENLEDLIKAELKEQFDEKSVTSSSLHSRPKESILLESLKSSLKETK